MEPFTIEKVFNDFNPGFLIKRPSSTRRLQFDVGVCYEIPDDNDDGFQYLGQFLLCNYSHMFFSKTITGKEVELITPFNISNADYL